MEFLFHSLGVLVWMFIGMIGLGVLFFLSLLIAGIIWNLKDKKKDTNENH